VYNTLHWIIDDKVALLIRLTDRSGKISFEGRELAKLVTGKLKLQVMYMNLNNYSSKKINK